MFSIIKSRKTQLLTNRINPLFRRNIIKIIYQGEIGYRLFLGRNPKKLEPGIRIKIPYIHNVRIVDMREGTISLPSLNAYSKDNVPVTISGFLFYKVENPYKSCFSVQNYLYAIENLGTSAARSVIGNFEYDEINGDRNQINMVLRNSIDKQCDQWGIECTRFEIQEFKPQNDHVMQYLEKQMEAERKRRENDLNTFASIRTAEGLKEAQILKSEGELIAAKNEAEALLIKAKKNAEGMKYKIQAEAEAKSNEIKMISEAFNSDSKSAYSYLIEMNRINQLKAIASGKNNSSFFVPAEINKILNNVSQIFK